MSLLGAANVLVDNIFIASWDVGTLKIVAMEVCYLCALVYLFFMNDLYPPWRLTVAKNHEQGLSETWLFRAFKMRKHL